jgi:hypothetical protein
MRSKLAVVVLAAVIAACSGGGSNTGGSTSSGSSTSTSSGSASAADQATADHAVLKLADLPAGYVAKADSSDASSASDADTSKEAKDCFRAATGNEADAADRFQTGQASATFSQSAAAGEQITGKVELFSDTAALSDQLAALSKPAVQSCLAEAFKKQFAATNAQIDKLEVTPTSLSEVGDESAGFIVTAKLTASGVSIDVGIEIDRVRSGRAGLTVTVSSLKGPADHELARQAAVAMAQRL